VKSALGDDGTESFQRFAQRRLEFEGPLSRNDAAKRAQEQWVAKDLPQSQKLRRQSGLAEVQPGRRPSHVAFGQECFQAQEQIQVGPADIHHMDSISKNRRPLEYLSRTQWLSIP
jgi:hypothetical protein